MTLGQAPPCAHMFMGRHKHSEHTVFCTIYFFVDVVRIDLFSLDIEGAEYDVLKTVPWDKVNIDALLVEVTFRSPCSELLHPWILSSANSFYHELSFTQKLFSKSTFS
jgi:hypothetical protein